MKGYSLRINDPRLKHYQENITDWTFVTRIILAVAVFAGISLHGKITGQAPFMQSVYTGAGLAGVILMTAMVRGRSYTADKTWDGTVVDKTVRKRTIHSTPGGEPPRESMEYLLMVQNDAGRIHTDVLSKEEGPYAYYGIGDRVRHHKGFMYYEKEDKSSDSEIICIACITLNAISQRNCARCGCPLLNDYHEHG